MRYILALSLAGLAVGIPNNSLWQRLTKRDCKPPRSYLYGL
jgi:hypothetical protein